KSPRNAATSETVPPRLKWIFKIALRVRSMLAPAPSSVGMQPCYYLPVQADNQKSAQGGRARLQPASRGKNRIGKKNRGQSTYLDWRSCRKSARALDLPDSVKIWKEKGGRV